MANLMTREALIASVGEIPASVRSALARSAYMLTQMRSAALAADDDATYEAAKEVYTRRSLFVSTRRAATKVAGEVAMFADLVLAARPLPALEVTEETVYTPTQEEWDAGYDEIFAQALADEEAALAAQEARDAEIYLETLASQEAQTEDRTDAASEAEEMTRNYNEFLDSLPPEIAPACANGHHVFCQEAYCECMCHPDMQETEEAASPTDDELLEIAEFEAACQEQYDVERGLTPAEQAEDAALRAALAPWWQEYHEPAAAEPDEETAIAEGLAQFYRWSDQMEAQHYADEQAAKEAAWDEFYANRAAIAEEAEQRIIEMCSWDDDEAAEWDGWQAIEDGYVSLNAAQVA